MMHSFSQLLAPLARRIRLLTARAVITVINDALKMQAVQVKLLDGEVCDNVERFQNYGFTSVPFSGAEGVYLSIGGDRDHGVVICVDDRRYRLKSLQPGETALYDDQGQKVHLTRNGIVVDAAGKLVTVQSATTVTIKASTKVRMETPLLEVTGEIKDNCDTTGKTMSGMRDIYNTHTHSDPQGGSVGAPAGQM